jgi:hypothetical protein
MSLKWPPKDKDETLDYSLDWSRALEGDETIASVSWFIINSDKEKVSFSLGTTIDGLGNLTQTNTPTVTTIYLSSGVDNREYTIYCSVTTTGGRTKERSVKIRIREYN